MSRANARPDDQIKASHRVGNFSGSVLGLYAGEHMSMRELMTDRVMASTNANYVAIAEHMAIVRLSQDAGIYIVTVNMHDDEARSVLP